MTTEKIKFTTERLMKLACPAGTDRVYVRDTVTRGLTICVTAKGSKTFYVYRRIERKPARVLLGRFPQELSVDAARKSADAANGEIAKGIDPRKAKRAARAEMTFAELFERHMEQSKLHNRRWFDEQKNYDRYLTGWSNKQLSEIDRDAVQKLHGSVGKNHGTYSANRVVALVSHIFRSTALNNGWTRGNPAEGIERFEERSRERFLQADELPRFFASLEQEDDQHRDFFELALLTGARRSNLQAMAWSEINFERAEWTIPMTKSGHPMTVPLVQEAMEILERRKTKGGKYVFPSRSKAGHMTSPQWVWKRVLERAGISDLRIHDLRRSYGSWMAGAGVSLPIIGKSLGHRTQSATAIYSRLSLDPVREAVKLGTTAMLSAAKGAAK